MSLTAICPAVAKVPEATLMPHSVSPGNLSLDVPVEVTSAVTSYVFVTPSVVGPTTKSAPTTVPSINALTDVICTVSPVAVDCLLSPWLIVKVSTVLPSASFIITLAHAPLHPRSE